MPFIGKQPEVGAYQLIDSITTSATATYALTVDGSAYFPASARNLIVSLNGVTQAPESAYTVSGSNIVFDSALTASDVIDYILVIGDAVDIGTPSDGTVGTSQLASSIDLSGKTLTFANDQISGDSVDGGTISNFASTGIDDNATSTAITIDSAENVGIGETNPSKKFHVTGNTSSYGVLAEQPSGYGGLNIKSTTVNQTWSFIANDNSTNSDLLLYGGSSAGTKLIVDSSGNLLVGTTNVANSATVPGHYILPSGLHTSTRDGGAVRILNRLSTDGTIADFRKDGTTVGSIGTDSTSLYVTANVQNLGFKLKSNDFRPTNGSGTDSDNVMDLGDASVRWDDVYATNGTIQTSDINEKQDIEALSEAEQRVAVAAKGLLRKFRWKSAVEEKNDEARVHFGIIAQDLKAAFEAEGLDAGEYGMFTHSTWTDEETGEEHSRMGVRYSELLAFIIAAI